MAANTVPIFPLSPRIETQFITDTDGTTRKLLFNASTDGSRINSMGVSSDNSASTTIQFHLSKDGGSSFNLLGTIVVAANYQGPVHSGIPVFDTVNGMPIPSGSSIYVSVAASVASGKFLRFSAVGSNY